MCPVVPKLDGRASAAPGAGVKNTGAHSAGVERGPGVHIFINNPKVIPKQPTCI